MFARVIIPANIHFVKMHKKKGCITERLVMHPFPANAKITHFLAKSKFSLPHDVLLTGCDVDCHRLDFQADKKPSKNLFSDYGVPLSGIYYLCPEEILQTPH